MSVQLFGNGEQWADHVDAEQRERRDGDLCLTEAADQREHEYGDVGTEFCLR